MAEKKKGEGQIIGWVLIGGAAWILYYYMKNGFFPWSAAPATVSPSAGPAVSTQPTLSNTAPQNINDVVLPGATTIKPVVQTRPGNILAPATVPGSSIPSDNPLTLKKTAVPAPIDATKYMPVQQVSNTVDNPDIEAPDTGAPLMSGIGKRNVNRVIP